MAGRYLVSHGEGFAANARPWVVSFELGAYDRARPLVIDPVLIYSTYLGGSGLDRVWDMAVDGSGSVYVVGETGSTNFPTANPSHETFNGGPTDVFVAKFGPAGTNLVYATYLGGDQDDVGFGIALGPGGDVYLTGATFSTNFPVSPNAVSTNIHGVAFFGYYPYDAFVVKLDPSGANLLYSTYLGGSDEENGVGIAVDSGGNAFVTGFTRSTDFPTNGLDSSFGGGPYDAFVAKLTTTDNRVLYGAYLGGSGEDRGQSIAVDSSGGAVVAGFTGSLNFPWTNAVQTNFLGGGYDVFVTRLSADGATKVFSTYLGGNGNESATRLALDAAGNVYLTGFTFSTDFPTRNAISSTNNGVEDVFVVKLAPNGTNLVYSTYFGSTDREEGWGIAVDASGSAYVTGETFSTNFFTANSMQSTTAGGSDVFLLKLTPDGTAAEFSTLFGGNSNDNGYSVVLDSAGNAYVAGSTVSTDFPTVPATNPVQTAFGGGFGDGFVAKIYPGSASLHAERSDGSNVTIRWPTGLVNYELQSTSELTAPNNWSTVTNAPIASGSDNTVTFSGPAGTSYFRLHRVP